MLMAFLWKSFFNMRAHISNNMSSYLKRELSIQTHTTHAVHYNWNIAEFFRNKNCLECPKCKNSTTLILSSVPSPSGPVTYKCEAGWTLSPGLHRSKRSKLINFFRQKILLQSWIQLGLPYCEKFLREKGGFDRVDPFRWGIPNFQRIKNHIHI